MLCVDGDGHDGPSGADGEICTRGPELFLGYLDPALNAGAFLPGCWYRTGDIGRLDAEGYLLITDRKKDIIIRGGENISSKEVEALLLAHPKIVDAAAVAAPDERMGEVRSEEHTSELQSLMRTSYAVFCLKQKKNETIN